jgi:hypothetical protein
MHGRRLSRYADEQLERPGFLVVKVASRALKLVKEGRDVEIKAEGHGSVDRRRFGRGFVVARPVTIGLFVRTAFGRVIVTVVAVVAAVVSSLGRLAFV